jgi:hypothetical protein
MIGAQRNIAAEEARGWIGTPFRERARRKGTGVNCLSLVLACWEAAGAIRALTAEEQALVKTYPSQWHLHDVKSELYIEGISKIAHRVEQPEKGDAVLYRPPRWLSHAYSHAAIVIEWPTLVIEANSVAGCVLQVNPSLDPIFKASAKEHPYIFFSPWGEA